MIHPSDAFPSHLVPILEGALLVAALLLFLFPLSPISRATRWVWGGLRRLAVMRSVPVALAAILALAAGIATTVLLGLPVPRVDDELSYLLAADTFAQGRLTNPSHLHWQHFEAIHVLQQPTYASKYPPAQGAFLALGRLLGGHEVVGLWLTGALLGATVAWLLLAWLPAPWALFGALIAVVRLVLGSYWGHTYWGGAVAAAGGALLYGGLARVLEKGRARDSVAMAAGLVLLGNSRPYEGLLVAIPAVAVLLVWLVRAAGRGRRRRVSLGLLAFLVPGGLLMIHYNVHVTGDPLRFPYQVHEATYNPRPGFLFQEPPPRPSYRNPAMEAFWSRYELTAEHFEAPWLPRIGTQILERAPRAMHTLLGPAAALLLLGLLGPRPPLWVWLALAPCVLLLVGQGAPYSWWPHYSAPATGPLLALAMAGGRRLQGWRWKERRVGPYPVVATLVVSTVVALAQLPALRPDPGDWSRIRVETEASLRAQGGRHLILVPLDTGTVLRWVWNRADIDGAQVVWAHELGAEETGSLLRHFSERKVWRLEPGPRGQLPRLVAANAFHGVVQP